MPSTPSFSPEGHRLAEDFYQDFLRFHPHLSEEDAARTFILRFPTVAKNLVLGRQYLSEFPDTVIPPPGYRMPVLARGTYAQRIKIVNRPSMQQITGLAEALVKADNKDFDTLPASELATYMHHAEDLLRIRLVELRTLIDYILRTKDSI